MGTNNSIGPCLYLVGKVLSCYAMDKGLVQQHHFHLLWHKEEETLKSCPEVSCVAHYTSQLSSCKKFIMYVGKGARTLAVSCVQLLKTLCPSLVVSTC